jgi:dTDP-4-dehydrorhamnose reductase
VRALITGAGGMLGRAVVKAYELEGEPVAALDHAALDITDQRTVDDVFDAKLPEVVINCAAWTDVDGCELDHDRALSVNAFGPELLALACRRVGALFITISTDYVFDGEKDGFYTQRDQPGPQSVYAVSKLEGERRAQVAWARTIVVRSGYIFGAGGKNFLSSVVARARRGEHIQAIRDSFGTPTYAVDLARQLQGLARRDLPGIYHLVNAGEGASFEQFARLAIAAAGLDANLVEGVGFRSLERRAPRPRNSRLKCLLSEAIGLDRLPLWQDAVRDFVATQTSTKGSGAPQGLV